MSKKRSSGLVETFVKSFFGFGTTVHYKKSFWGKTQKQVKNHSTGVTKTHLHGCGLFGNVTRTETQKHGRTIEKGELRKNFLWGSTERSKRSDGTQVTRTYTPGLFMNHVTTQVKGMCYCCKGTGTFHLPALECSACHGKGCIQNSTCLRCRGTGQYKPPMKKTCKKCGGSGIYSKFRTS